jgi:hypothetical protein
LSCSFHEGLGVSDHPLVALNFFLLQSRARRPAGFFEFSPRESTDGWGRHGALAPTNRISSQFPNVTTSRRAAVPILTARLPLIIAGDERRVSPRLRGILSVCPMQRQPG